MINFLIIVFLKLIVDYLFCVFILFSLGNSLIELINWIELITMQLCTYQYYAHYPSQAMYGERYGICLTSIWHQNLYYKWEIWPLYACTEVWALTSKSPHKPHLLGGEIPDSKKSKHRCNKVYHTVGYKISNIITGEDIFKDFNLKTISRRSGIGVTRCVTLGAKSF